ncbi:hypothetical protein CC1G_12786 [Coprinopsis cinerea okayama7|uniref:Uncharacterized protein n=1 Tax=Coprinopsis cinerea (strain Okayama-7 / 130 / ATCC MYA-4618 / FGSC 9003) TaxID=240176 RepID=A8PHU3_COPC7|nr:hypothetical protein CC1G_12786 [Coprinopsis cinerea okayama7\|eukprot:XP_001841466.2 hypothetical protein CC1G_12786 [Coprinopsis cinerea okayama7\
MEVLLGLVNFPWKLISHPAKPIHSSGVSVGAHLTSRKAHPLLWSFRGSSSHLPQSPSTPLEFPWELISPPAKPIHSSGVSVGAHLTSRKAHPLLWSSRGSSSHLPQSPSTPLEFLWELISPPAKPIHSSGVPVGAHLTSRKAHPLLWSSCGSSSHLPQSPSTPLEFPWELISPPAKPIHSSGVPRGSSLRAAQRCCIQ